jgi:hypothetical protein
MPTLRLIHHALRKASGMCHSAWFRDLFGTADVHRKTPATMKSTRPPVSSHISLPVVRGGVLRYQDLDDGAGDRSPDR